jgi:hypothetical protein
MKSKLTHVKVLKSSMNSIQKIYSNVNSLSNQALFHFINQCRLEKIVPQKKYNKKIAKQINQHKF